MILKYIFILFVPLFFLSSGCSDSPTQVNFPIEIEAEISGAVEYNFKGYGTLYQVKDSTGIQYLYNAITKNTSPQYGFAFTIFFLDSIKKTTMGILDGYKANCDYVIVAFIVKNGDKIVSYHSQYGTFTIIELKDTKLQAKFEFNALNPVDSTYVDIINGTIDETN